MRLANTGSLHFHTQYSMQDSCASIEEYVKTAKEMRMTSIAVTDHRNCAAWVEFMNTCNRYGIKPILGVEIDLQWDYLGEKYPLYRHMILLAENRYGMETICRLVSGSGKNLKREKPVVTRELLESTMKERPGGVICLSGCIQGILSAPFFVNRKIDKILQKKNVHVAGELAEKTKVLSDREKDLKEIQQDLLSIEKETGELSLTASKTYSDREKELKKRKRSDPLFDELAYMQEMNRIEEEKEETQEAKKELRKLRSFQQDKEKEQRLLSKEKEKLEKEADALREQAEEVEYLTGRKRDEKSAFSLACSTARYYRELFGEENFFIELQYHGLPEEKLVLPYLTSMAYHFNIPVVATNDGHMVQKEDIDRLSFTRSMRFNQWEEPTDCDRELYLKSNNELYDWLVKGGVDKETAYEAICNIGRISVRCQSDEYEPKNSFCPKFRGEDGTILTDEEADMLISIKIERGVLKRFSGFFTEEEGRTLQEEKDREEQFLQEHSLSRPIELDAAVMNKLPEEYRERMQMELETFRLETFRQKNVVHYHLIVEDILRYARSQDPYGVGPGRGSCNGSLICYSIGITQLDPVRNGLLFERYLNPDRITMPDIDMDFANGIREDIIGYCRTRYGEECVASIRTVNTFGAKDAIRQAANVLAWKKYPIPKGKKGTDPLLDQRIEEAEQAQKDYQQIAEKLKNTFKEGFSLKESKDILLKENPGTIPEKIITLAAEVEGSLKNFSTHAAGIIISDGTPLRNVVPMMCNSNGVWFTAWDKEEVEQMKLLKMDFLGLTTMDVISETCRNIHDKTGKWIDLYRLPLDDPEVYKLYCTGDTSAVFQVEGDNMTTFLLNLKPSCFTDLVLAIAVFRPGPMQYIDDIITAKNKNRIKVENVFVQTRSVWPVVQDTYFSVVYQEQVMKIFQIMAGYSLAQADLVRRAMSKKKDEMLEKEREAFIHGDPDRGIQGCLANHIPQEIAEKVFTEMKEFSKYAFNRSHSAAYAFLCYITAWLKTYYPEEFYASTLNHELNMDKMTKHLNACQKTGLRILSPDVNRSEAGFSVEGKNQIRYGLSLIAGVASSGTAIVEERLKNGEYTDLADFISRTKAVKVSQLAGSGALVSIAGRISRSTICENEKEIKSVSEKIDKNRKSGKSVEEQMQNLQELLDKMNKESRPDPAGTIYNTEKKLLGIALSGSPLDDYAYAVSRIRHSQIAEAGSNRRAVYIGIVEELRVVKRKKDGQPLAFFTLTDLSGQYPCACFVKEYSQYGDLLEEGAVLCVTASTDTLQGSQSTLVLKEAGRIEKNPESMYVLACFPDMEQCNRALSSMGNVVTRYGCRFAMKCMDTGNAYMAPDNLRVSINLKKEELPGCLKIELQK